MLVDEERGIVYRLLAGLLLHELQGIRWQALATHWCELFKQLPQVQPELAPACERCLAAISLLTSNPDSCYALRADFCQLFLQDAQRTSAAPYASLYQEQPLLGLYPASLHKWFEQTELRLNPELQETPDHLAALLELMAELATRHNPYLQLHFLQEQLLNWLPQWAHNCQQKSLAYDFYPAIAQLINQLCQLEYQELQQLQQRA